MDTRSEKAFDAFVRARIGSLSRTAYLLTGDHHRAEDLVQTTLLRTARAWHRIHGEPLPYVRRTMLHEHISAGRRRRFREVPLDAHDDPVRDVDHDLRLVLAAALDQLTAKQRAVVVLRFYEDLTEVETAAALGIRPGTVKSTTRDALARMRRLAPHLADHLVAAGEPR